MTRRAVFNDGGTFDDGSPISTFPSAVSSVFGRTGAVIAVAGDYYAVIPSALTGATQAFRIAGATTSGAPVSGTFAVGDLVAALDGHLFMCIVAGTPGTWVDVAAAASGVTSISKTGSTALTGAVTLTGGTNVTLTQSGNDISIAAAGGSGAGSVLDYVSRNTDLVVTAASAAAAQSWITGNSVSYSGSTQILIEAYAPLQNSGSSANELLLNLWEDSTDLGRVGLFDATCPVRVGVIRTPAAGSHTYTWKVWKGAGSGRQFSAGASSASGPCADAWLRITVS